MHGSKGMLKIVDIVLMTVILNTHVNYCYKENVWFVSENRSNILDGDSNISNGVRSVRSLMECALIIASDPRYRSASYIHSGKICFPGTELGRNSKYKDDSVVISGYLQGRIQLK